MKQQIEEALGVRYIKLHFTVKMLEDTWLPSEKVSAIRGGMGEMLLRANCVRNRSEERRVGKECRSRWSPYH